MFLRLAARKIASRIVHVIRLCARKCPKAPITDIVPMHAIWSGDSDYQSLIMLSDNCGVTSRLVKLGFIENLHENILQNIPLYSQEIEQETLRIFYKMIFEKYKFLTLDRPTLANFKHNNFNLDIWLYIKSCMLPVAFYFFAMSPFK